MRIRSLRFERQPRLMIIPMIDIIFFLLVFFMMNTLYMVEQNTVPISLPQAASAQKDYKKPVSITFTSEGRLFIEQEEIPVELLAKRVLAEQVNNAETVFVLRADKHVEYGQVIDVLDRLKVAGVQRLTVATEGKPR